MARIVVEKQLLQFGWCGNGWRRLDVLLTWVILVQPFKKWTTGVSVRNWALLGIILIFSRKWIFTLCLNRDVYLFDCTNFAWSSDFSYHIDLPLSLDWAWIIEIANWGRVARTLYYFSLIHFFQRYKTMCPSQHKRNVTKYGIHPSLPSFDDCVCHIFYCLPCPQLCALIHESRLTHHRSISIVRTDLPHTKSWSPYFIVLVRW